MTKTNKQPGSYYAVSGMMLMAHKLGVRSYVQLTEAQTSGTFYKYEVSYLNAPISNWSLDPNDEDAVQVNRRSVLFNIAMLSAADAAHQLDKDVCMEYALHFERVIEKQRENCVDTFEKFLEWHGKEDCKAIDVVIYLDKIFTRLAEKKSTKKQVEEITDFLLLKGGEITATELMKIISPSVAFGILEYKHPTVYPTWKNAFSNPG